MNATITMTRERWIALLQFLLGLGIVAAAITRHDAIVRALGVLLVGTILLHEVQR